MNNSAVDTHRLMYRNARIRALDLSDRTSQLNFYNITEANPDGDDIGNIVYTDPNGYLFYGNNTQPISCLAVKQSAIIQVDLHDTNAWNIEWIVEVATDSQYVTIGQIGKVYDHNGNLLWNPVGNDWQIPDWVQRSEIGQGEWAEGQMNVDGDSPETLDITKWTHTIIFRNGHADVHALSDFIGRYGQAIALVNVSNTSVTINGVNIPNGSTALAVYDRQTLFGAWHITRLDSGDGSMHYRILSVSGNNTVTLDDPAAFYIIRTRYAETLQIIANVSRVNGIVITETGDCPVRLFSESVAMDKYVCVGDSVPFTVIRRNGTSTLYVPDSGRYAEVCTCEFGLDSTSGDTRKFVTSNSEMVMIAKSFGVYQFTLNMEAQSNDTKYLNVVIPYNMNNRIATMHIRLVASDNSQFHDCQYTVRLVNQVGETLHEFTAVTVDGATSETLFRGSVII